MKPVPKTKTTPPKDDRPKDPAKTEAAKTIPNTRKRPAAKMQPKKKPVRQQELKILKHLKMRKRMVQRLRRARVKVSYHLKSGSGGRLRSLLFSQPSNPRRRPGNQRKSRKLQPAAQSSLAREARQGKEKARANKKMQMEKSRFQKRR